jgi:hypothetical protein
MKSESKSIVDPIDYECVCLSFKKSDFILKKFRDSFLEILKKSNATFHLFTIKKIIFF